MYTGWSVTVAGAFVYRAGQLGLFKQIQDLNPYKDDKGTLGAVATFVAVTTARTVIMPFNYPFDTVSQNGKFVVVAVAQKRKKKFSILGSSSFDVGE